MIMYKQPIENIAALRRDHPQLDVVVKLHQKDKRELYESVLEKMPGVTLQMIEQLQGLLVQLIIVSFLPQVWILDFIVFFNYV